jgi:hypothetical protein
MNRNLDIRICTGTCMGVFVCLMSCMDACRLNVRAGEYSWHVRWQTLYVYWTWSTDSDSDTLIHRNIHERTHRHRKKDPNLAIKLVDEYEKAHSRALGATEYRHNHEIAQFSSAQRLEFEADALIAGCVGDIYRAFRGECIRYLCARVRQYIYIYIYIYIHIYIYIYIYIYIMFDWSVALWHFCVFLLYCISCASCARNLHARGTRIKGLTAQIHQYTSHTCIHLNCADTPRYRLGTKASHSTHRIIPAHCS